MNKCSKQNFGMILSGLILCTVCVSACAKHVQPDEENNAQVTAELCNEVDRYDDWSLYHDQWVSETFDYERYQWKAGKGYPVKKSQFYEKTDYDKYSTETLMRLAQDGDKAANLELAQRYYYFSSGNLNSAEPFCYMAVVDGFSAMTSCMISSYGAKLAKEMAKNQSAQSDRQRELRLMLLGWIEISKDVDDIFAKRFAETLKPGYQRNDITDVMIENAAQDIRQKLKVTRKNRKPYKETLTVDVEQKMPELWRILEKNKLEEQVINGCINESHYAKQ
ncbi:MAG TPA: hypothetical protein VIM93_08345 [Kangiella sp.]